jgi:aminoglycoside 3-N-acetyltransferase
VVGALRDAVGEHGNIVVLTATEANSKTSRLHRARMAGLTADEVAAYLRRMPAFESGETPSGSGAISEAVRTSKGAVRSAHPQSSFAAIGPDADFLMAGHRLHCHHGEESPLAKLYAAAACVLMMGVTYKACTALHLAEYRYTPHPPRRAYECVVSENGTSRWVSYQDVVLDDGEFEAIGDSFENKCEPRSGYVGDALCRLFPLRNIVNHATEWMKVNRS